MSLGAFSKRRTTPGWVSSSAPGILSRPTWTELSEFMFSCANFMGLLEWMAACRTYALVALAGLVFVPVARAEEAPSTGALTARIDRFVEARLQERGVAPGAEASEAEFLRRVFLDLAGRIPSVAEARAFFDDAAPDKRARLVDRLLASPEYARNFATVWRKAWLPQAETPTFSELSDGYEAWLREELSRETPYDRMVVRQLTASFRPPRPGRPQPARSFLEASQFKPENLAANTTRAFLGLNLDCAQCHNHPFARWTRDNFWQTAAFFDASPTGLVIEGTDRAVTPALLTGEAVKWPDAREESTGRTVLASWITSRDNPFFARNAVNRLWAHCFGTGLVEPLDDLSEDNPAGPVELLGELAAGFGRAGFDLKLLIRSMVLSRAYQRTSAGRAETAEADGGSLARMPVRALSGEQLHNSLLMAAGLPASPANAGVRSDRGRFVALFRAGRPSLAERSVSQTLTLYNGTLATALTRPETSPILKAVARSPFLDDAARVDTLYLATLSRWPDAAERTPLVAYLAEVSGQPDRERALGNLFWALINSTEFNSNH